MNTETQHRIDNPHPSRTDHASSQQRAGVSIGAHAATLEQSAVARRSDSAPGGAMPATAAPEHAHDPEHDHEQSRGQRLEVLLSGHAEDLIQELQRWSEALDRRESELNARQAQLEHSERSARMFVSNRNLALDERERTIARRQNELKEQLARLAIGNLNY